MNFHQYGVLFVATIGILALLVASPGLSRLLAFPRTEFFTEFWILDSNHKAEDYPFNITRSANYSVFLGIGNRLGHTAYYLVEVKFRNQTQSAPNSFNRTSSSLPSLFNVTAFVADENTWEYPLTFSLDYVYNEASSRVEFSSLKLNSATISLTGYVANWDPRNNGFLCSIFFELWIYDGSEGSFVYHDRSVGLWLNANLARTFH
jgi:hypothetical protein